MVLLVGKILLFIVLIWLILMLLVEEFYRRGIKKNKLLQRFSGITGIEMILIFISDLGILFVQDWAANPLRYLILVGEFILGVVFIVYWRYKRIPKAA